MRRAARFAFAAFALVAMVLLVRHAGVDSFLESLRRTLPWLPVLFVLELLRIATDAVALRSLCGEMPRSFARRRGRREGSVGASELRERELTEQDCASCWCTLTLSNCHAFRLDPRLLQGRLPSMRDDWEALAPPELAMVAPLVKESPESLVTLRRKESTTRGC